MTKFITSFGIICFSLLMFASCKPTAEGPMFTDNFDRKAALEYWADNMIIPAFEEYKTKTALLRNEVGAFKDNPTIEQLEALRLSWLNAYKIWQRVSLFDIGEAESLGLRAYTNIYPTNIELIQENISNGLINLELPSNFSAQGFPALDYLLYGIGNTEQEIIDVLVSDAHISYLQKLADRIHELANIVHQDWLAGYRDVFIDNNGSSNTASFDKLVNDYLFYYEKYFRGGKIGIPAGVFSGNYISNSVEAPYSGIYSKDLYNEAFSAIKNFFNGVSFDENSEGPSIKTYLEYIQTLTDGDDLSTEINTQWDVAKMKSDALGNNFKEVIETDPIKMLELYDELQKVVVLLKVEMLQDLNIKIDYVDADGD